MKRLGGFLVAWMAAATLVAAEKAPESSETKPDLTGVVVNEEGEAVRDASVFIYTAGPRVGPGYI